MKEETQLIEEGIKRGIMRELNQLVNLGKSFWNSPDYNLLRKHGIVQFKKEDLPR